MHLERKKTKSWTKSRIDCEHMKVGEETHVMVFVDMIGFRKCSRNLALSSLHSYVASFFPFLVVNLLNYLNVTPGNCVFQGILDFIVKFKCLE
jgi:hypothetical protein